MPDAPKPGTVGDLLVAVRFDEPTKEWVYRPATVADLVSALRAEEWELHVIDEIEGGIREVLGYAVPECNAGTLALRVVLDTLAEVPDAR